MSKTPFSKRVFEKYFAACSEHLGLPNRQYIKDLTDDAWALVVPLLPTALSGRRRRTIDIRTVLNAIFSLLRNWLPMAVASLAKC